MQRGRDSLLHHFEMFIAGIDGEKMILVIIISCKCSSSSIVQLFVIIWKDLFFKEINKFFIFSEIVGMSS